MNTDCARYKPLSRRIRITLLICALILAFAQTGLAAEKPLAEEREQKAVSGETVRELARVHYARARTYYRRGEFEKAKAEFEEVLKIEPNHQGALWYLKWVEKDLAELEQTLGGRMKKHSQEQKTKSLQAALDAIEQRTLQGKLRKEKVKRKELEKEETQLLKQLEKYGEEKDKAKRRKYVAARKAAQLQKEKQHLETKLKEYEHALKEQVEQIRTLQQDSQEERGAQLKEAELERHRLVKQLEDLRQRQDGQIQRELEKHEKTLRNKYEQKIDQLKADINAYENKVQQYEVRLKQLEETTQALGLVQSKQKQLKTELTYLHKEQEQLLEKEKERLEKVSVQTYQETVKLKQAGDEIKRLRKEVEDLRQDQQTQLREGLEKYEKVLQGKLVQKEAELDEKVKLYEDRIKKLKQEPESTIEKVSDHVKIEKIEKDQVQLDRTEARLLQVQMQINEQLHAQLDQFKKEKARPLYEQGLEYFRHKKYPLAKEGFQKALSIYPDYQEVQQALSAIETQERINILLAEGRYYYQQKDYSKARQEFNQVLDLDYKNKEARNYLHRIEEDSLKGQKERLLAKRREKERLQKEKERLEKEKARLQQKQRQAREQALARARQQAEEERMRRERQERLAKLKAEKEERLRLKRQAEVRRQEERRLREEQERRERQERMVRKREEERRIAEERKAKAEQESLKAEKERKFQERINILLAEGRYYYQQKDYSQARQGFNQVLDLDYKNKEACNYLHRIEEDSLKGQKEKLLAKRREKERLQKEKERLEQEKARLEEKQRQAREQALARARQQVEEERIRRERQEKLAKLEAEKEERLRKQRQAKKEKLAKLKGRQEEEQKKQEEKLAKEKAEAARKKKELQRKIELHYTQGKKHFKNKDYIAARKEFKDILILDPKNKYAINAIEKVQATIAKQEREFARRQKEKEKVAQKEVREKVNKHLANGKIYFYRQRYKQAMEEFAQVFTFDPHNALAEKYIQRCKESILQAKRRQAERLQKEGELKAREEKLAKLEVEKQERLRLQRQLEAKRREEKALQREQRELAEKIEREKRLRKKGEAHLKKLEQARLIKELRRKAEEEELLRKRQAQALHREQARLRKEQQRKLKEERLVRLQVEKEEKLRCKLELEAERVEQVRLEKERLRQLRLQNEAKKLALQETKLRLEEERAQLKEEKLRRQDEIKAMRLGEIRLQQQKERQEKVAVLAEQETEKERKRQRRLHLAQGKIYYYREEYELAMEEFKEALLVDAEYPAAERYLQLCQKGVEEQRQREVKLREQQAQRLQKAAKTIKEEKEKERLERIKQLYDKGKTYLRRGFYTEAIACFEKVIELEGNPRIHYTPQAKEYIEKAQSEMEEEEKDKAEEIAEEEIERRKAQEEQRLKAKQRAEAEARRKEEEIIRNHYKLGKMYYRQGNYPTAIAELNKIMDINPLHRYAAYAQKYIQKCRQRIMQREETELKLVMKKERKSLEKETVSADNLLKQARWYYKRGDYEQTEKICRAALELDYLNKDVRNLLYKAQLRQARQDKKYGDKERFIAEEDMMADVAGAHALPEEKVLPVREKEIIPIVKVPPTREKLRSPITVDFRDVDLTYVLNFLADSTGVNIIPASGVSLEGKKVTIRMKDIPAENALKYILKNQGLTYRLEQDAVWVASPSELDKELVESRVYFLNRGSGMFTEFDRIVATGTGLGGAASISKVTTIKDILEEAVDWPKDSKLVLDERSGALVISNTPSNLQIIEEILYNLDITPMQVLIEARFVELEVVDVAQLGIEWQTTSIWGTERREGANVKQVESGAGSDFTDFARVGEGLNFTYTGVLTYPQFQAVLHALTETKDAKTLSAPKVTTLNNQLATIKVVDEWIYPTRYEFQVVQEDINGDGDFDDAGETKYQNVPVDFVTKDVGILLHVTPNIGADNKTITLALIPEVSEGTADYFSYAGSVSLPKFSSRTLSTSTVINNGETVVLGGMIKETSSKTVTKVPLLGDIPILGNLFRKTSDSVTRKNLLIFVTATIISPTGERIETVVQQR